MLNRRLLRVKVLQALYSTQHQGDITVQKSKSMLHIYIGNFYKSYLLCLQFLVKLSLYNEKHKERLGAKHIKSNEDVNYSLNLLNNPVVQALANDTAFQHRIETEKQQYIIKEADLKTLYNDLTTKNKYQVYISNNDLDFEQHQKMLIYIFNKLLLKSALFKSYFEDLYLNWFDDKEFVYKNINDSLRNLNQVDISFNALFSELGKESRFFAESLLIKTLRNQKDYEKIIEPFLKNWDLERVTSVDIIILKLAISEFCDFSEIPVKVTINEYIELSKLYSTPKSKDFVNGILDKLMKELKSQGKIIKSGRGLVDL